MCPSLSVLCLRVRRKTALAIVWTPFLIIKVYYKKQLIYTHLFCKTNQQNFSLLFASFRFKFFASFRFKDFRNIFCFFSLQKFSLLFISKIFAKFVRFFSHSFQQGCGAGAGTKALFGQVGARAGSRSREPEPGAGSQTYGSGSDLTPTTPPPATHHLSATHHPTTRPPPPNPNHAPTTPTTLPPPTPYPHPPKNHLLWRIGLLMPSSVGD